MEKNRLSSLLRPGVVASIAATILIAGYSLYAALPYLLGPSLSVKEHIENGLTIITGETARVSYLSINGAPVPLTEDGSFRAVRSYPPGYTGITVSVKDRFGRELTKMLALVTQ